MHKCPNKLFLCYSHQSFLISSQAIPLIKIDWIYKENQNTFFRFPQLNAISSCATYECSHYQFNSFQIAFHPQSLRSFDITIAFFNSMAKNIYEPYSQRLKYRLEYFSNWTRMSAAVWYDKWQNFWSFSLHRAITHSSVLCIAVRSPKYWKCP